MPKLNQRRYAEVVRLLKEVVANPKAPTDRRMRAAAMLLDIYSAHDRRVEKAEAKKQSSLRAKAATDTPDTHVTEVAGRPEAGTPDDPRAAAQRFLDAVRTER